MDKGCLGIGLSSARTRQGFCRFLRHAKGMGGFPTLGRVNSGPWKVCKGPAVPANKFSRAKASTCTWMPEVPTRHSFSRAV